MIGGYNEILTLKDGVYKMQDNICPSASWILSICVYKDKYILVDCSDSSTVNVLYLDFTQTGKKFRVSGTPQSITTDGSQIFVGVWGFPSGVDVFA